MTYQNLKSLVTYLVETAAISLDKQSTVYNYVQKRIAKIGVTSVIYELSDTQTLIVSRDSATYLYTFEIITLVTQQQVTQLIEQSQITSSEPVVQLSLNLHYEVDIDKLIAYLQKHPKPRRLKKVIDNTPTPQLAFNFDVKPSQLSNVVNFRRVVDDNQYQFAACG